MTKQRVIGARALRNVRKFFPNVKKVTDADEPVFLEVTENDSKTGSKRDHNDCAFARATARKFKASGVIVSVDTAYVIKGEEAVRYKLPQSVSREIVSFDRDAGFQEGQYELSTPVPSQRLGKRAERGGKRGGDDKRSNRGIRQFRHTTGNIRAMLGSGNRLLKPKK